MKFINLTSSQSKQELMPIITDCERVNERVKFDEKRGRPRMKFKEKGNRLRITCEMIGGATKDNGFFIGTYFIGSIKEKSAGTTLKGIIVTAPFYHLLLLGFMIFYVYRCISLGGFNPVPPILLLFSIFMFMGEFRKQGIIERYLHRAFRKAEEIRQEK